MRWRQDKITWRQNWTYGANQDYCFWTFCIFTSNSITTMTPACLSTSTTPLTLPTLICFGVVTCTFLWHEGEKECIHFTYLLRMSQNTCLLHMRIRPTLTFRLIYIHLVWSGYLALSFMWISGNANRKLLQLHFWMWSSCQIFRTVLSV